MPLRLGNEILPGKGKKKGTTQGKRRSSAGGGKSFGGKKGGSLHSRGRKMEKKNQGKEKENFIKKGTRRKGGAPRPQGRGGSEQEAKTDLHDLKRELC